MSSTEARALAIPQRPKTEIATGFNLEVRRQLAAVVDIEAIEEARRKLAAWQAYVTKREQRKEIAAATRWCEVRIGELLGKVRKGERTDRKPSPAREGCNATVGEKDRYKFRLLAEHKSLVAELIAGGQVSRGHLLAAIKERNGNRNEKGKPDSKTVDAEARVVQSLGELTGQQFGCIYADPPWQYGNQSTRAATDNHYGTLSVDELCDWPVEQCAADDAHLHLWTTNAFLFDAKRVMDAWGFEYRSVFVWVKPQMGIGNYWRVSHEFLLLGIRGNAKRFADRSLRSWAEFDRTRHSSKPEEVRGFVESASPGPYLELFGRKPVSGWTVLGNQVEERLFA